MGESAKNNNKKIAGSPDHLSQIISG